MFDWFDNFVRKYFEDKFDFVNILSDYDYVSDFKIKDNIITAEVFKNDKVSTIEIQFKKFTKTDIKKLNKCIDNPISIVKLANGIIPDEIYNLGVKIFPDSVKDFKTDFISNKNSDIPSEVIAV